MYGLYVCFGMYCMVCNGTMYIVFPTLHSSSKLQLKCFKNTHSNHPNVHLCSLHLYIMNTIRCALLFLYWYSDLSHVQDLQTIILSTFSSQTEEVRAAASYALGT